MTLLTGDFEPCADYRRSLDHDEPLCAACGHLADDHTPGATVLALPERGTVALPARRAS